MQLNRTKKVNISILFLLSCTFLVLLRTLLLVFGFDFEMKFFTENTLVYPLYVLYALALILPRFLCKNLTVPFRREKKSIVCDILFAAMAALFLSLALISFSNISQIGENSRSTINLICNIVAIPTALLSSVYYIMRIFSDKTPSVPLSLAATCVPVFLSSVLVREFAEISSSSASLYYFPDVMSLLILAFFVLDEGKHFIPNVDENSLKKKFYLFSLPTSLLFSALPDLITILTRLATFGLEGIVLLIMKLVFSLYAIAEAVYSVKNS